jgi:hypothetical protein
VKKGVEVVEKVEEKVPWVEKKVVPWGEKYNELYDKLEDVELSDEYKNGLMNSILMEKTPNHGNIIIMYDNKKKSFIYYSDASPSYVVLENVVKRYVCLYKCKRLFIGGLDDEEKEREVNNGGKVIINRDKVSTVKTVIDENNYTKMEININCPTTKNRVKPEVKIKSNTIRLTHFGKIANYSFLKKPKKEEVVKVMSYKDYKRLRGV